MFLDCHPLKYNFTTNDLFWSLITGASGVSYAKRHWQASEKIGSKLAWGHRAIALIEALPVVGGIAAVIERISYCVRNFLFARQGNVSNTQPSPPLQGRVEQVTRPAETVANEPVKNPRGLHWKARAISIDKAIPKMLRNEKKAIQEHAKKDPESYASITEALPEDIAIEAATTLAPLQITHSSHDAQGPRNSMEDYHFFHESEEAVITGVLDGHGGREIGELAGQKFTEHFFNKLSENQGNVHQTLEWLIDEIQKEVVQAPSLDTMGTTAVICYIDKRSHLIYTATIGDSEANIYRTINSKLKSVPLSCVRDWSSAKDAKRAALALNMPEIETAWPQESNTKRLRYPTAYRGINVSRAIGDAQYLGFSDKPAIIHKPKITMYQLKAKDTLILACDGLKDYVPESEIRHLLQLKGKNKAASDLVKYAIDAKQAMDNVTVIAINIA